MRYVACRGSLDHFASEDEATKASDQRAQAFNQWTAEFPDGQIALLTFLSEGQQATVLQLPAEPKTVGESEAQQRVAHVG